MAETAAAGSVAERAAAVCMQQARLCNEGEISLSLSFSLPLCISLYLILLNHCSSKLRCSVSPFGHKRSSKPGSQERHHFPPGGGCLSSQKRLDALCGSLHVYPPDHWCSRSDRSSAAAPSGQPMGAQASPSSPRPQNNTQRASDTAPSCEKSLGPVFEIYLGCSFFPPSVHCIQVLRNRSSRNTQSNKLCGAWTWGAEKARAPGLVSAGIWRVFEDRSQSEEWLSAGRQRLRFLVLTALSNLILSFLWHQKIKSIVPGSWLIF